MSSCDDSLRKGPWSVEEDEILRASVALLGERRWDAIARATGLKRSGKSCRLRWLNYLRPSLKHSPITVEEEQLILRLHLRWGNKWARIARRLPGRTDNEIKNYWRGCIRKKTAESIDQTGGFTNKVMNTQEASMSPWSSDDEADYNDIVEEALLKEDKTTSCEEASSSSDASGDCSAGDVSDALVRPKSPYESHFSNWVSLLRSENELIGNHCNGVSSSGCCNWSWEEGNDITVWGCWDKLWN